MVPFVALVVVVVDVVVANPVHGTGGVALRSCPLTLLTDVEWMKEYKHCPLSHLHANNPKHGA